MLRRKSYLRELCLAVFRRISMNQPLLSVVFSPNVYWIHRLSGFTCRAPFSLLFLHVRAICATQSHVTGACRDFGSVGKRKGGREHKGCDAQSRNGKMTGYIRTFDTREYNISLRFLKKKWEAGSCPSSKEFEIDTMFQMEAWLNVLHQEPLLAPKQRGKTLEISASFCGTK